MKNALKFAAEEWWLSALIICVCFTFPNALGIKVDAAVYGGLARMILKTHQWWPLGLAPDFFPTFYDHPPGVVWIMAVFLWVGQNQDWFVNLFGRLCTLAIYLTGFAILLRYPGAQARGRCIAFAVVLSSWLQWLKTAPVGQLDGPVALMGTLTLYATLLATEKKSAAKKWWFLALGFAGFLFKGVFYILFVGASGLYLLLKKPKALSAVILLIGGCALALGFLALLDYQYSTQFFAGYFLKQVAGSVVTGATRETSAWAWQRLPELILVYFKTEISVAVVWSLPCWLLSLWTVTFGRKRLKDPLVLSALCFYGVVNGAIALSTAKMPSWSVISYPMGALFMTAFIPERWLNPLKVLSSRHLRGAAVITVLLFAILPYGLINERWGRGEEWNIHSRWIRKVSDATAPFILVRARDESVWPEQHYQSFYLTPFVPTKVQSLNDVLREPCRGGGLAGIGSLIQAHDARLRTVGWVPEAIQVGSTRFYHCAP